MVAVGSDEYALAHKTNRIKGLTILMLLICACKIFDS